MSKFNAKPYKQGRVILDKKFSVVTYLLTLVLAVIARTSQLYSNMDFMTGKYINHSPANGLTTAILVIGFALTLLVMIFGKSRDKAIKSCILLNPMRLKADRLNKKISVKAGATMLIMAFLIVFDVFLSLSGIINRNKELSTEENPISIFAGIRIVDWVMYACAIITIITFISIGSNIVKGEGITRGNCVFLSVFAIWKLLQIFSMITNGEIIGIYSEKIYILLTAMSSSMFFLYTARFFAGFEKKNTRYLVCMFGYISSILAAVSTVPRYIIYFIKSYDQRSGMATPSTSDVGIIFVTIAIVSVFWSTYVYRVMPRLSLGGKRRWLAAPLSTTSKMESIDEGK